MQFIPLLLIMHMSHSIYLNFFLIPQLIGDDLRFIKTFKLCKQTGKDKKYFVVLKTFLTILIIRFNKFQIVLINNQSQLLIRIDNFCIDFFLYTHIF